jgi:hypothetical protein
MGRRAFPRKGQGLNGVKEEEAMDSGGKFLTFTSIIILALILQGVLVIAEQRDTPDKAAAEFARAYFWLDTSMADRLCKELGQSEAANVVEGYLRRVDQEARSLGYAFDYMKQELYQIETRTSLKEADKAQVRLTATRKRAINPVFGAVAEVFALTQPHRVEATIDLVREDDRWKVCGHPFALTES